MNSNIIDAIRYAYRDRYGVPGHHGTRVLEWQYNIDQQNTMVLEYPSNESNAYPSSGVSIIQA